MKIFKAISKTKLMIYSIIFLLIFCTYLFFNKHKQDMLNDDIIENSQYTADSASYITDLNILKQQVEKNHQDNSSDIEYIAQGHDSPSLYSSSGDFVFGGILEKPTTLAEKERARNKVYISINEDNLNKPLDLSQHPLVSINENMQSDNPYITEFDTPIKYTLIRNIKDYAILKSKSKNKYPEINFDTHMLIALETQNELPDDLITIISVDEENDKIVLNYIIEPFKVFQTDEPTTYRIIKKSNKKVVLNYTNINDLQI